MKREANTRNQRRLLKEHASQQLHGFVFCSSADTFISYIGLYIGPDEIGWLAYSSYSLIQIGPLRFSLSDKVPSLYLEFFVLSKLPLFIRIYVEFLYDSKFSAVTLSNRRCFRAFCNQAGASPSLGCHPPLKIVGWVGWTDRRSRGSALRKFFHHTLQTLGIVGDTLFIILIFLDIFGKAIITKAAFFVTEGIFAPQKQKSTSYYLYQFTRKEKI